jgi:hypothetical protein
LSKALLISRPRHDIGTNYLFHWSQRLIDLADKKGIQSLDLQGEKANKKEFEGRAKKMKPELVVMNGHGAPNTVTGHDNMPLLDKTNTKSLKGAIIYARSCDSASQLGPQCINDGSKAYIGYVQPFWLCYDTDKIQHPLEDKIAAHVLEPSNQVVVSLLKGNTAIDASNKSKRTSQSQMTKLMSSDAPDGAAMYLKCVWSNMRNQVCLGNTDAKISS